MLLIPYELETLYQRRPFANWAIIGVSVILYAGLTFGFVSEDIAEDLVLQSWSPVGLIGYQFLHLSFFHLLGNMIFLWVFGNAICSNTNNWIYPLLYLMTGVLAGATHLLLNGAPALGASGAINGVVGLALAMYPLNRVYVFWWILIRAGSFSCPVWVLTIVWFVFDIWGAFSQSGGVAYWAHIGGFLSGVAIGLLALQMGWIQITEDDNRSLLEIFKGEYPE